MTNPPSADQTNVLVVYCLLASSPAGLALRNDAMLLRGNVLDIEFWNLRFICDLVLACDELSRVEIWDFIILPGLLIQAD